MLIKLRSILTADRPQRPQARSLCLHGEKWKALSEKQRAPYEAKAAADKKRYEEEKAAYQVCWICLHETALPLTSLQAQDEEEEEESE